MFFRFHGRPNSTTLSEFDKKHHNLWCQNHSSAIVRRSAMRCWAAKKGQNSAETTTKTDELLEVSNALTETQSLILPKDTIQGDPSQNF